MELKFKYDLLYHIMAAMHLIMAAGALHITIMLSIHGPGLAVAMSPFLLLLLASVIYGAVYYLKRPSTNYIKLEDGNLIIHRGPAFLRKKVPVTQIDEGRLIGSSLILILSNDEEVKINTKMLKIRDIERLTAGLAEFFPILHTDRNRRD
ncbi:MAG TPA: hypothetical protein VIG80_00100 [Bacillaceae bacterium]